MRAEECVSKPVLLRTLMLPFLDVPGGICNCIWLMLCIHVYELRWIPFDFFLFTIV